MNENNFTLNGKGRAVIGTTSLWFIFKTIKLRIAPSAWMLVFFTSCFFVGELLAEGTKQLQPTNLPRNKAPLYINASNDSGGTRTNFAGWGVTDDKSRLYINIQDPANECIFIGLGDWIGLELTNRIRYRVIAPNGMVVKEMTMTSANIADYNQAYDGPNTLAVGGYDVNAGGGPHTIVPSDFVTVGNQVGDYYIEFSEETAGGVLTSDSDGFSIGLYDFTVAACPSGGAATNAIDGRVWSYRWEFRQEGPEGGDDYEFDGAFYVCAEDLSTAAINDGFVTYIDFESPGVLAADMGFIPVNFNVIFNDEGPGIGTTPAERRKSQIGCSQLGTPLHKAFLNDPVGVCVTATFGQPSTAAVLEQCGPGNYCWVVSVTKFGGEFEVLLDLDGTSGFQMGTADVLLTYAVMAGDEGTDICIPWDGLDGNGNVVDLTTFFANVSTNYLEGIFHFPIFDAEANTDGFAVSYVRPNPGTPLMIKWDDSAVNGGTCDASCGTPLGPCPKDIGVGCVDIELNGCDPIGGCTRCWQRSYGDRATLNTYWNIFIQALTPQDASGNFYECSIIGDTVLCGPTETTTLSANIVTTGAPTGFTWQWEDPNGNITTGTDATPIPSFVGLGNTDLGTYTLTLSFGLACTTTCSVTLIEETPPVAPVIVGGDLDRDLCDPTNDPLLIEVQPSATVPIYEETFEEDGAGVTAICEDEIEIALCSNYTPPTNVQWTLTGTAYDLGNGNGEIDYLEVRNGQLEAMDIDGTLCFETTMIDISSSASVGFSLDISEDAEEDLEADDNVAINYSIDGAAFINAATLSDDFAAQTITEMGLMGNTLQLQVCFTNNDNEEHYFLDNVTINASAVYYFYDVDPTSLGATPVATGPSYTPTIADGTTASIWVTCFNGQCESEAVELMFNNDCCSLDVTCAATVPNTNLVCPSELPTAPASFNDFAVKGDEAAFEALHASPDFIIDDNFCGEIVITSADANNGGTGCAASPLIVTRTYTILDDEDGNGTQNGTEATATCSETFTFIDNAAPTFANCVNGTIADPIERDCNMPPDEAIVLLAVGAPSDNCSLGTNMATASMTSTSTAGCVVTEIWTATVTDACGITGTCTATFTYISDNTDPTFPLCDDNDLSNNTISLGCNITTTPTAADAIAAVGAPIDVCGFGTNQPTAIMTSTTTVGCLTTEVWTVSITDACGNDGDCIVNFEYLTDTDAPTFANCTDGIAANDTIALGCNATAPTSTDAITAAGAITETCNLGTNTATASRTNVTTVTCLTTEEWTVSVSDSCGNVGECMVYFTYTIDHNAPILPCQTTTTLALSGDGSEVHYAAFVNTIVETCGLDLVQVRRQDMAHCEGDDSSVFSDKVPFYCCDVGNTVTVEVQATDVCGNMNSCNVFVIVEDNIVPMIDCPADKSIDCDSLHLLSTYDKVTIDDDGQIDVPAPSGVITYVINLDDPANPDTIFLGYFEEASIWENCDGATMYVWDTGSVDDCGNSVDENGNLLPIQRHHVAVDGAGNVSATCIQEITVSNLTPFDPTTIVWPAHYMNPGPNCGDPLHPDSLPAGFQRPVITASANCENLAIGYSDSPKLYPTNPTSTYCYKILRSWNVLNWCTDESYDQNQVLMVVDPGPVFTSACPDAVSVVSGTNLIINKTADNLCSGTTANITYTVDLNNDGSIDDNGNTGSINAVTGGALFPEGTHKITFTAEGCTQNSTCEFIVEITPMSPPDAMSNVSGSISNEANAMVGNVMVSPAIGMDVTMTDESGAFSLNLPSSENYELIPQKDGDYLNGVSTYDIVLLSKHILQTQPLNSPYKMIAGDVNKSGSITTLDLVELRKIILFINDEFPNNSSWRFVDADYVFPNATNPFEEIFPESYAINGLSGDMEDLNFIAVKIGDVNGSAVTNGLTGDADDRDLEETLNLEIEDAALNTAETKTIAIKAKDFNSQLGYQFTMLFDHLEVLDVIPGELPGMSIANFGTQALEDGILTTSWNTNEALSLPDETVLFSVEVKAAAYVRLSEVLHLSSRHTTAEAYTEKESDVVRTSVAFIFHDNNTPAKSSVFELYQNRPNPFKNETVIGFDLPEGGAATLTIYDLSGRVLMQVKENYAKGYNEVSIQRNELPAAGVLYYELSTGKNTALRKMTIVD